LIEIVLDNAAGVEAGQTTIRFRDVNVGTVERIDLSPDLTQVIATARIRKDVAKYVDDSARFWVVRPSVTAQGVSGIETVISGVYIGAYWDDTVGPRQDRFDALPRQPLTPADQPGLRVRLRAPDGGSMTIGAPVLFKSIEVGRVEDISLTDAGDVMIDVFVNAPNSARLTEGTRFWNASGFSIDLSASGASLNVDSLISLLQGGVSFDTVGSDVTPVESGHVYNLYPSENAARQNQIADEPGQRVQLTADFEGSVRGLEPGASIEYRGLPVGEVTAIQAVVEDQGGTPSVSLRATLSLVPARFGIGGDDADEAAVRDETLALIESEVADGMRARLETSGLLSQSLFVNLVTLPDAEAGTLDRSAEPYPRIPTAPSDTSNVAASAQGLVKRITDLPLEQVVDNAVALLSNVNDLISSDEVRAAPENLGLLLADARTLLNQPGIQEVPGEIAAILASVREVVDRATQAQLVENLSALLAESKTVVTNVGTASEKVPALLADIQSLSEKLRDLPTEDLVASASRVIDSIDALVRSDDVNNIPATVNETITEMRTLVEDLRTGGAVENVNATLASVRQVSDDLAKAQLVASLQGTVDDARAAIGTLNDAATGVPGLIDEIEALSAQARALPLDDLVARVSTLLETVDTFLASQGVTELPDQLNASLTDLRGLVGDLRSGGAVDNVNATLASVRQITDDLAKAQLVQNLDGVLTEAQSAAGDVSAASKDLPALIDSLTALSNRAAALPLDDLVTSANGVLESADSLLAAPGVSDVPSNLAAALDELRVTLEELIAELNNVASTADAALASLGPNSDINRETLRVLQEVRDAVRSVTTLVQSIERRPNSVIFGR
jgi:paraquat-inducible protein B